MKRRILNLLAAVLFVFAQLFLSMGPLAGRAFADLPGEPVGPDYFGVPSYLTSPIVSPTAQTSVREPLVDDLNNDGKSDIVTLDFAGAGNFYLVSRLGNGDATFNAPSTVRVSGVVALRLSDFNGDGFKDALIVGVLNSSQISVEVRLGMGNGTFGTESFQATVIPLTSAIKAFLSDVNQDGNVDVVVYGTNPSSRIKEVYVMLGSSSGTFTLSSIITAVPGTQTLVGVADLTTDGKPDLLLVSSSGVIYSGDGSGSFNQTSLTVPLINSLHTYTVGDFNGDGKVDVVWHQADTQSGGFANLGLRVFINQGGGAFRNGDNLVNGGAPYTTFNKTIVVPVDLLARDINNDGSLDVLARTSNGLGVYVNNGTGHFTGVQRVTINNNSNNYLTAGDLNRDGNAEVVTGGLSTQVGVPAKIAFILNISTPADGVAPTVSHVFDRIPDGMDNWYRSSVTIKWTAVDPTPSSGSPTQPPNTIADQEGERTYVSGLSCDPKNNCATGTATVKIDKTAPVLATPTWSASPKAVNEQSVLTVPVNESISGLLGGEYYLGDTDPGHGNGATMTANGNTLTTTFGTDFTPGTYKVNVRAKDKAGNWSPVATASLEVYQPDTVAPNVTGATDRTFDRNDWFNHDVTINWTAVDPDPSSGTPTQPAPTLADVEGVHTYTSALSCDPAGNCGTGSKTVNLDKTAPIIDFSLSQQPNAAGWNNQPVTVTFNCTDTGSGTETCTQPVTVSAEGVTIVTGTAMDRAGNVSEINVFVSLDTTAPTITQNVTPAPNATGWNTSNVTVAYDCSDSLSGPADCSPSVTLSNDGAGQVVTGTATDVAGNITTVTSNPINIDKTAPNINFSLSQAPNGQGWNNGPVTVTFDCFDATSGVTTCTGPVTVTAEGGTIVTGTAVDGAGNVSEVNVFIFIDSSLPTITSNTLPVANGLGWNNTDVTVGFDCSDAVSGVASCSSSTTLINEGASQVVAGTAVDNAGNTNATSRTVSIDMTAPVVGQFNWQTSTKAVTATSQLSVNVSDNLSGVTEGEYFIGDTDPGAGNGATMAVNGSALTTTFGTDFPTGVYKISVRAKDAADNWSMAASGYLVVYNPNGPRMTGKADKNFIPTLANGDILPNLIAGATDAGDFGFNVKYNNLGQIDANSDLQFSYNTGTQCQSAKQAQSCHVFELNATAIEWLTTQGANDSTGIFQGSATLNIDGVVAQVVFRLTGVDGNMISATSDTFQLQIFAAGADPNTAAPLYKINPTNVDLKSVEIK